MKHRTKVALLTCFLVSGVLSVASSLSLFSHIDDPINFDIIVDPGEVEPTEYTLYARMNYDWWYKDRAGMGIEYVTSEGTSNVKMNMIDDTTFSYTFDDYNLFKNITSLQLERIDYNGDYKYWDISCEAITGDNLVLLKSNENSLINITQSTGINTTLDNHYCTYELLTYNSAEVSSYTMYARMDHNWWYQDYCTLALYTNEMEWPGVKMTHFVDNIYRYTFIGANSLDNVSTLMVARITDTGTEGGAETSSLSQEQIVSFKEGSINMIDITSSDGTRKSDNGKQCTFNTSSKFNCINYTNQYGIIYVTNTNTSWLQAGAIIKIYYFWKIGDSTQDNGWPGQEPSIIERQTVENVTYGKFYKFDIPVEAYNNIENIILVRCNPTTGEEWNQTGDLNFITLKNQNNNHISYSGNWNNTATENNGGGITFSQYERKF